jgi:hypothetical protein
MPSPGLRASRGACSQHYDRTGRNDERTRKHPSPPRNLALRKAPCPVSIMSSLARRLRCRWLPQAQSLSNESRPAALAPAHS